jgi:hypothetical protein
LLRGLLFGGYTVIAVVAAWSVGITPRASDILSPHAALWTWLAHAGAFMPLGTILTMAHPQLIVVTNAPAAQVRRRLSVTQARSRPTRRRAAH